MDTANGGYLKYGGYHRLFGGHDIACSASWKRYGWRYPIELAKDFLTKNGLPYPKLQYAVRKGWIRPSTAQKWGTWNIGKAAGATFGVVDSALNFRLQAKDPQRFAERWKSTTFKATCKIATGCASGTIPLAAAGCADLTLVAYSQIQARVEFNFEDYTHTEYHAYAFA